MLAILIFIAVAAGLILLKHTLFVRSEAYTYILCIRVSNIAGAGESLEALLKKYSHSVELVDVWEPDAETGCERKYEIKLKTREIPIELLDELFRKEEIKNVDFSCPGEDKAVTRQENSPYRSDFF